MYDRSYYGTLKSNKGFYIGDICYVLNDDLYQRWWGNNYPDGKIDPNRGYYDSGVFDNVDGTEWSLAVVSTGIGDGLYYDEDGNEYGVDAGVIGVIPLELIEKYPADGLMENGELDIKYIDSTYGRVVLGTDATIDTEEYNEGTLYDIKIIGESRVLISINTDPDYDEDEYEEDEYEEDDDW